MLFEDRSLAPYQGNEPYIFLSYSHRDAEPAADIIRHMNGSGFRIWYDEGLVPGKEWDENIARAIMSCSYFVALISQNYLDSTNCRDELNYARDKKLPLLLIYLEDVELPAGMEMRLGRMLAIHRHKYTMAETFYAKVRSADGISACRNFEGQERLRQLLLNKPPKFGNNDPYVDGIYREMMHYVAENVQSWPDARGGHYAFGIDSQTMNVPHGEVTGALPDGRLAGEPLCDNASPMMGRDVNGPTATVLSVASMGQDAFHDGALFNLRFDPKGVEGEKGLNIIEGVIKTFFDHGGEHIQINVVDTKTLRDAQKNPENYKGLMVRVAGYMAYFTELDESAQEAIIYRTAHLEEEETA